MSGITYNWKRFWCPRAGRINLTDGGYLSDPESKWGNIYNPDVVTFESISQYARLVFLGEPEIGKSHSMEVEYCLTETKIKQQEGQTIWLDLRSYGSEDRLIRNLFENNIVFGWKEGHYPLHIFLDSLDECLLRIDTLATLLADELKNCPVERLYLRIACRTAEWPNILEKGLRRLWKDENVGIYELVPLRRVDVEEAAATNGLDSGRFLSEIDRVKAVPLAIKPITLAFLNFNIFNQLLAE